MSKLSDEDLKYQTKQGMSYETMAMARELLAARASLKSFEQTQEMHLKTIEELNTELAAAERVVSETSKLIKEYNDSINSQVRDWDYY